MELNHYTVFSSDERRVTTAGFRGGRVTAVFAELELDLRAAETPGFPAVIDLRTVFAETTITVPNDWNVDVRLSTPLCEFRDRRSVRVAGEGSAGGPDLVLTGFGVISEITLRG
ncbi:LiaF domain-containing protein [Halococcus saccharolyticus]|uniref:Putative transmembrane protein n=1 Tax=Halococcus saccharolyticus DSM 5350 TaxID=1227455 RepID=M0MCZ3_9EURY|nr:LiaF domain-containing protein [Halococcus saccharolyticus]EMA43223.1 putative transmembrane protein [Halococcus saccharolyticus DSM 5350]